MERSLSQDLAESQTIHIAFTINEAYVKYFVVCLTSILESAGDEELHFYVIHDDITEHSKKRILELKHIKDFAANFIVVNPQVIKQIKAPTQSHISANTSYRLKIGSIMQNLDRIIFLDADLIVKSNLLALWNTDISNYYLASVVDQAPVNKKFNDWIPNLKLPNNFRYVNTGVCLCNLKKWREDNMEKLFFDVAVEYHSALKFPEQDILNIACAPKILKLSHTWNAMPLQEYIVKKEKEEAFANPHIIHYAGYNKPWIYLDAPYADLFWKYARKTSYYEELLYGCKKETLRQTIDDIYWLMREIQLKKTYYRKFIKYKLLRILTLGLVKKYRTRRNKYHNKLKYLKKRFAW
ncbi:MAG: glycosyltransferase family 8 protein [Helicobacteraceae bacterium]|jgi:lipopolysaccharide biosynthesis glycosyltransferase|nr:glycosyltransferase family 8 protein [Helicobacteraceae bacterium]